MLIALGILCSTASFVLEAKECGPLSDGLAWMALILMASGIMAFAVVVLEPF